MSKVIRGGAAGGAAGKAFKAMSADDPDVVAFWNFTETSGEFTDSVNSLELARLGSTSFLSFNNYELNKAQVTDGGPLKNIAPGYLGLGQRLGATGVNSTLSPGTGSLTFEFYGQFGFDHTVGYASYCYNIADTVSFFVYYSRDGALWVRVYANDGTFVTASTGNLYKFTSTECQYIRVAYDAGSTVKLFLNGVEIASSSAASLSGKTVEIDEVFFGGLRTGLNYAPCAWYQIRISHNATNDGYGYE